MTGTHKIVLSDNPKMAKIFIEDQLFAEIKNALAEATAVLYPRKDGNPWQLSYYLVIGALEDAKRQLYYNPPPQS